jgi:hypothetical protein
MEQKRECRAYNTNKISHVYIPAATLEDTRIRKTTTACGSSMKRILETGFHKREPLGGFSLFVHTTTPNTHSGARTRSIFAQQPQTLFSVVLARTPRVMLLCGVDERERSKRHKRSLMKIRISFSASTLLPTRSIAMKRPLFGQNRARCIRDWPSINMVKGGTTFMLGQSQFFPTMNRDLPPSRSKSLGRSRSVRQLHISKGAATTTATHIIVGVPPPGRVCVCGWRGVACPYSPHHAVTCLTQ